MGKNTVDHFMQLRKRLKGTTSSEVYLMLNGSDHLYPQPDVGDRIKEVREAIPDIEVHNGSIQDYMDALKERLDQNELRIIEGELRKGKYALILPSEGSTRYYIKQENHKCELELEKYAEPLSAAVYMTEGEYLGNLIYRSWKELVRNHAHDSITGCSADEVIKDVMTRFRHSYQISSRISELELEKMASEISVCSIGDEKLH